MKVLISGGGTGGHIFPAISIANAVKEKCPDVEILFVGAENRMEMEKVPAAGYKIEGLPVSGFSRRRIWKNVRVLYRLFKSIRMARKIIDRFQPDIAVGVGGYASGPTLGAAAKKGVPTLIQEQNSYAGVTNKLLAGFVGKQRHARGGDTIFRPRPTEENDSHHRRQLGRPHAEPKRHRLSFPHTGRCANHLAKRQILR